MRFVVDIGEAVGGYVALCTAMDGEAPSPETLDHDLRVAIDEQCMSLHSYIHGLEDNDFDREDLLDLFHDGYFKVDMNTVDELKRCPESYLNAELFNSLVGSVLVFSDPEVMPKCSWKRIGNILIVE